MKTSTPSKPAKKRSEAEKSIGGQPENDEDAQGAGLKSATSAKPKTRGKRG